MRLDEIAKIIRSKNATTRASKRKFPTCERKQRGCPSRPVRIVAGFVAGANTDRYTRLVGQFLSQRLGSLQLPHPFPLRDLGIAALALGTTAMLKPDTGAAQGVMGGWTAAGEPWLCPSHGASGFVVAHEIPH